MRLMPGDDGRAGIDYPVRALVEELELPIVGEDAIAARPPALPIAARLIGAELARVESRSCCHPR